MSSRLTQNSLCLDFHHCLWILGLHRAGLTSGPVEKAAIHTLLRCFCIFLDVLKQKEGRRKVLNKPHSKGKRISLIIRALYQNGINKYMNTCSGGIVHTWTKLAMGLLQLLEAPSFQVSETIYLLPQWQFLLMSVWSVLLSLHQSLAHFLLTKIKINVVSEDVSNLLHCDLLFSH